jgi:hypothetical protein
MLAFVSSCEYRIWFILAWEKETVNRAAYQMILRWGMLLRSSSFFLQLFGHPMNGHG